jgi:hypothetical protein
MLQAPFILLNSSLEISYPVVFIESTGYIYIYIYMCNYCSDTIYTSLFPFCIYLVWFELPRMYFHLKYKFNSRPCFFGQQNRKQSVLLATTLLPAFTTTRTT